MIRSLIMAFSTYSRVPMPRVKWDEKYMKFIMCFFPFVGAFIGAVEFVVIYALTNCDCINVTRILTAALVAIIPILITGGIHMDGFMDTVDAKNSYKPMEEKLKILKDPHTGAFAIIYGIVYMLLYFALACELVSKEFCTRRILVFALGFALERVLSGLSVVVFKKAKKDGMMAGTSNMSDKKSKYILVIEYIVLAVGLVLINVNLAIGVIVASLACFIYYGMMAKKTFGGVTGDLAGFFLQICELAILAAVSFIPM